MCILGMKKKIQDESKDGMGKGTYVLGLSDSQLRRCIEKIANMKSRLRRKAGFTCMYGSIIAVFISVFCLTFERGLAYLTICLALVELGMPIAFEITWIFSEIPSCAEEKGTVDFSGSSDCVVR